MLHSSATVPFTRIHEQPQADTTAYAAPAPKPSVAPDDGGEIAATPAASQAKNEQDNGKAVFNGFQGPAYPPCLPPDLFD